MPEINNTYKNQRELHYAINNALGNRGVNDYGLTSRFPFFDVLYKEDGLSYTLFHSVLLDKWITLVRDPQKKDKIVGEIVYTIDKDTGEIKVLETIIK